VAALRSGLIALALARAGTAWAAAKPPSGPCPSDLSALRVREVALVAPLAVMPWTAASVAAAERQLNEELGGRLYRKDEISAARARIEQQFDFAKVDVEQPVAARFISVKTKACSEHDVDLEFFFFVPRLVPTLGVAVGGGRLRATPRVEYDRAEKMSLGVRAGYAAPRLGPALSVDARAAPDAHALDLRLEGATDPDTGAIARTQWRLAYRNSEDLRLRAG